VKYSHTVLHFPGLRFRSKIITLTASSRRRNVTVWHPSVPTAILTVTHQGAACDAASVHFGLTAKRSDRLVRSVICWSCVFS